jgi:hypothetical protein
MYAYVESDDSYSARAPGVFFMNGRGFLVCERGDAGAEKFFSQSLLAVTEKKKRRL